VVLEPEAVAEDVTDDVDEVVVVVVDMVAVMSMKPAVGGVSLSVTVILELRCTLRAKPHRPGPKPG
jgi:hypothetical protein